MKNIYLNASSLSWQEFIKYFISIILVGLSFIFMKNLDIIQIDSKILYDMAISVLLIFIFIQVISKKLNKCIVDELSFRSDSLIVIIIPILIAAITRIFTNILEVLPILLGGRL